MAAWDGVLKSKEDRKKNGLDDSSDLFEGSYHEGQQSHAQPLARQTTEEATLYRFSGVAPPAAGKGALKHPNQLLNVKVISTKDQADASGKPVVWFEIHTSSVQYEWGVWKRFSDCSQLAECLERLNLSKFKKALDVQMPKFPSKFHLGSGRKADFVEKRRLKLEEYFTAVCEYLKKMHLHILGIDEAQMAGPLQAAFQMFVDFLRSSSKSHGRVSNSALTALSPEKKSSQSHTKQHASPVSSPVGSPLRTNRALENYAEQLDTPSSKLLLQPGIRFIIVLFVPGIPVHDVYVEMMDDDPHGVLVGGKWNSSIESLLQHCDQIDQQTQRTDNESLQQNGSVSVGGTEGPSSPSATHPASSHRSVNSKTRSPLQQCNTLMDTLPSGEFEMVYEIPIEFDRTQWFGEHADGVLFLIWNKLVAVETDRKQ